MPNPKFTVLRLIGRQEWLRFEIRNRLLARFAKKTHTPGESFTVDFFGLKYTGTFDNPIDWKTYFYGAYDRSTLMIIREILCNTVNAVALDIGANTGHHTLFMSLYCDTVHAFEPYPPVCATMRERILQNQRKNVTIHPTALGDVNDMQTYYAPVGFNQGTGSFVATHNPKNNQAYGDLPVVRGDDYIAGLNLPRLTLIKIDVESYERQVLQGMQNILQSFRPTIVTEFSPKMRRTFRSEADFYSVFPEGYQAYEILNHQPRMLLFNRTAPLVKKFKFNQPEGKNLLLLPDNAMLGNIPVSTE